MALDIITNVVVIVLLVINFFVLYFVVHKQRKTIETYENMFRRKTDEK